MRIRLEARVSDSRPLQVQVLFAATLELSRAERRINAQKRGIIIVTHISWSFEGSHEYDEEAEVEAGGKERFPRRPPQQPPTLQVHPTLFSKRTDGFKAKLLFAGCRDDFTFICTDSRFEWND